MLDIQIRLLLQVPPPCFWSVFYFGLHTLFFFVLLSFSLESAPTQLAEVRQVLRPFFFPLQRLMSPPPQSPEFGIYARVDNVSVHFRWLKPFLLATPSNQTGCCCCHCILASGRGRGCSCTWYLASK